MLNIQNEAVRDQRFPFLLRAIFRQFRIQTDTIQFGYILDDLSQQISDIDTIILLDSDSSP